MIHNNPETLINFLKKSQETISEGKNHSVLEESSGFNFFNQNQINFYISLLNEAFGYEDEFGNDWDWMNLEPEDYPDSNDLKEDYIDSNFIKD